MAGVIRLGNTGGGQSTISGSASSNQTYILPAQGGTLSVGGGGGGIQSGDSAVLDDLTVSGDLRVSGTTFMSGQITASGGLTTAGNVFSSGFFRSERAGGASAAYQARFNGNLGAEMLATGTLRIGGEIPADPQIELNADGSAIFASGDCVIRTDGDIETKNVDASNVVTAGNNPNAGGAIGIRMRQAGQLQATAVGINAIVQGFESGNASSSFTIRGNGSCEFASGLTEILTGGGITTSGGARIGADIENNTTSATFPTLQLRNFSNGRLLTGLSNDGTDVATIRSDGSAAFATNRVQIANDGRITLSGSPGIQFGTPNAGGNITSQTLNDYEEGTWTPGLQSTQAGGDYDLSNIRAQYVKVGNSVTAWTTFDVTRNATGGGTMQFTGLPFNYMANSSICGTCRISDMNIDGPTIGDPSWITMIQASDASSAILNMIVTRNNNTAFLIEAGPIDSDTRIQYMVNYRAG